MSPDQCRIRRRQHFAVAQYRLEREKLNVRQLRSLSILDAAKLRRIADGFEFRVATESPGIDYQELAGCSRLAPECDIRPRRDRKPQFPQTGHRRTFAALHTSKQGRLRLHRPRRGG
jgi:hypothetical protein